MTADGKGRERIEVATILKNRDLLEKLLDDPKLSTDVNESELLLRPTFSRDVPGPEGDYQRPVWLTVEIPSDIEGSVKLDAAHPLRAYQELLALLEGWADALMLDPPNTPPGLTALVPPVPHWDLPIPAAESPVEIGELLVAHHYMGDEEHFLHDHVRIHASGRVTIDILLDDEHRRWEGVTDLVLGRWQELAAPLWTLAPPYPQEPLDHLRLEIETPKQRREVVVDLTDPPPEIQELVGLFVRWTNALGDDSSAKPEGLHQLERTK